MHHVKYIEIYWPNMIECMCVRGVFNFNKQYIPAGGNVEVLCLDKNVLISVK